LWFHRILRKKKLTLFLGIHLKVTKPKKNAVDAQTINQKKKKRKPQKNLPIQLPSGIEKKPVNDIKKKENMVVYGDVEKQHEIQLRLQLQKKKH
jgi:hypothetical protein